MISFEKFKEADKEVYSHFDKVVRTILHDWDKYFLDDVVTDKNTFTLKLTNIDYDYGEARHSIIFPKSWWNKTPDEIKEILNKKGVFVPEFKSNKINFTRIKNRNTVKFLEGTL